MEDMVNVLNATGRGIIVLGIIIAASVTYLRQRRDDIKLEFLEHSDPGAMQILREFELDRPRYFSFSDRLERRWFWCGIILTGVGNAILLVDGLL